MKTLTHRWVQLFLVWNAWGQKSKRVWEVPGSLGLRREALTGRYSSRWKHSVNFRQKNTEFFVQLLNICTQYKYLWKVQNTDFLVPKPKYELQFCHLFSQLCNPGSLPHYEQWKVLLCISSFLRRVEMRQWWTKATFQINFSYRST